MLRPMSRRGLIAALPGLGLLGATAHAQQIVSLEKTTVAEPQAMDALDAWIDQWGRPTARVMLNGQGPFRFLVDTGSTTTVLSQRVATSLLATSTGVAIVNGTTGAAEMPVANLALLETGAVTRKNVRVAIISDAGLAREDGILGADVFAGKRLSFDIASKIVRVENSQRGVRLTRAVNMNVRNGLLAEIAGTVGGVSTRLMLDTGAQNCIVNPKLEAALYTAAPRLERWHNARVIGVTGHVLQGTYMRMPRVDMGKVNFRDGSAIAADAPIFKLWGLEDEPAMIIGVDMLSRLRSFSIDYGARRFDAELMADLIARGGIMLG